MAVCRTVIIDNDKNLVKILYSIGQSLGTSILKIH